MSNQGATNPDSLAARLHERMAAGGWTNEYLAAGLGVTVRTIERWRHGDAALPAHIWLAIDELEYREAPRAPAPAASFRERMEAAQWTVAELASELGAAPHTIRTWRRQERPPAPHVFLALDAAERRRGGSAR